MVNKQGAGRPKTPEEIPTYQRRADLLAQYWNTPYSKLSKRLKRYANEIEKDPFPWDSLSAQQRALLAKQYDALHDPAGHELLVAGMEDGYERVTAEQKGATAVRLGYLRGRSKDIDRRDYIAAIKLDRGQEGPSFQWPDKADDAITMATFVLFLKQHSDNIPGAHPLQRARPTTTVPSEHYDLVLSIRSLNFPMTINGAYQYARHQGITMRNPSRGVADVVTVPVAVTSSEAGKKGAAVSNQNYRKKKEDAIQEYKLGNITSKRKFGETNANKYGVSAKTIYNSWLDSSIVHPQAPPR